MHFFGRHIYVVCKTILPCLTGYFWGICCIAYHDRKLSSVTKNSEQVSRRRRYSTHTRFTTRCLSHRCVVSQDLRRHFPAKFRRALNLDEIKPETVPHGPYSALLARLGLKAPSPPSPRSQPTFASPRRGHRESTTRGSSRDDASFEAERSSRSGSLVDEAQRWRGYGGRNRRALSIPTPRRPLLEDGPATSGERGRLRLTAPGRRKEIGR